LCRRPRPAHISRQRVDYVPLPDPLILNDGRHVDSGSVWRNQRRTELIELFAENEYGHTPTKHLPVRFKLVSKDEHALGGKAVSER
jgi:hypothetical protein